MSIYVYLKKHLSQMYDTAAMIFFQYDTKFKGPTPIDMCNSFYNNIPFFPFCDAERGIFQSIDGENVNFNSFLF